MAVLPLAAILAALVAPPPQDDELKPGLVGEYFSLPGKFDGWPEISALLKPTVKQVDARVDFPRTKHPNDPFGATALRDWFYVRWTGVLRVPRDGAYRFFARSDDGSRVWIDGRRVGGHEGNPPSGETAGEPVTLKAGDRDILVEFYEGAGHCSCIVSWEGPGVPKQAVPASALLHWKGGETADRTGVVAFERDPRIVPKDSPRPDLVGRVIRAYADGTTVLMQVAPPAGPTVNIFVRASTRTRYVGIERDGRKPAAGYVAALWLKKGSKETADRATFAREKDFPRWRRPAPRVKLRPKKN